MIDSFVFYSPELDEILLINPVEFGGLVLAEHDTTLSLIYFSSNFVDWIYVGTL